MTNEVNTWASLHDLEPQAFEPLWAGRVNLGTVTLIEGRKGLGKSTLATAIAASICGGPALPGQTRRIKGRVCWAGGEEDLARAVRPRLVAAGAKLQSVWYPQMAGVPGRAMPLDLPGQGPRLQKWCEQYEPRLIVLDPLSSHCQAGWSLNDEQQARTIMESLGATAAACSIAVIAIRHCRKSTIGPVGDQGIGSVAIAAAARSVLRVDPHPDQKGFQVLSQVFSSFGPVSRSLVYQISPHKGGVRIKWQGESDLEADQLAEVAGDQGERDERADARAVLISSIGSEWTQAATVMAEARAAGIGERRLRSAKAELRIPSRRISVAGQSWWEWGPPVEGWPEAPPSQ